VKLAYSKNASGRKLMRERHRRDRMLAGNLGALYPQVASIRLDFEFKDEGTFVPVPQVTVMHPPASAYFRFPCPYDDCDGDFDLSQPVGSMLEAKKTTAKGKLGCCGSRSGNKGKFACTLSLHYSIDAQLL
jgi:hypothetical protein